jgi:predicted transposase/invertase (TIGR01784 family)
MARFIDPRVDWAFKRIFGSEDTKECLITFLNGLFEDELVIKDVTFAKTEKLGLRPDDRGVVFDRMRIVYLQLPLFDKHTEAECMDIFDCWIYIMKNMNMFEQMPFSEKYPVFRKLAEIGDLRKLSREELELYDEDIKNMRDIYATRKFDEKRGMEKGMAKEKIATAYRLLSMGLSEAQVSTATELPLEEIQKIRK